MHDEERALVGDKVGAVRVVSALRKYRAAAEELRKSLRLYPPAAVVRFLDAVGEAEADLDDGDPT